MIFLILCITLTSLIIISFKLFEKHEINIFQAIIINYLIAATLGFLSYSNTINPTIILNAKGLGMSCLTGCMFIIGFSLFALSTQKAGMTLTTVSSKMSVIIPILAGVYWFKDSLNTLKIIGILAAFCAFYLTLIKKEEFKIAKHIVLFPMLVFFATGIIDTISNAYEQIYHPTFNELSLYLFIVFTTALLIGTTILIILQLSHIKHFSNWPKHLLAGLILGILNYYATFSFMKGIATIATSVFIPLLNVGIVTVSTLTGFIVFKEHLSKVNWIGILLAIIAIIFISQA